jgi:hypothetical protein
VDPGGVAHTVERANFANIKTAILNWFTRGNTNKDNLLLFFFCGHGLGKGSQTILLAEDFGSMAGTLSLNFAVDFNQMYLGMDQCTARQQCFFVDACRVGTPFALNTLTSFGEPVIPPSARPDATPRSAPVLCSAVPGATAYGRPDTKSFFTEAVLGAFLGAGADDPTGVWRVTSDVLHRGIHTCLRRAVAHTAAEGQLSIAEGLSSPFLIHELQQDPIVPVDVTCVPETHNKSSSLRVTRNGDTMSPPSPIEGPWALDLRLGMYQFEVKLPVPHESPAPVQKQVRPPYRIVEFGVS